MQVDTLALLLQALTAFHGLGGKRKKRKEKKKWKGSPWQQLLQFGGCNVCDDIIQTSPYITDQRYPLVCIPPTCQSRACAPPDEKTNRERESIMDRDINLQEQYFTRHIIQLANLETRLNKKNPPPCPHPHCHQRKIKS